MGATQRPGAENTSFWRDARCVLRRLLTSYVRGLGTVSRNGWPVWGAGSRRLSAAVRAGFRIRIGTLRERARLDLGGKLGVRAVFVVVRAGALGTTLRRIGAAKM